jgi:hypothetical protein
MAGGRMADLSLSPYPVNVVEACQRPEAKKSQAAHAKPAGWQIPRHHLCVVINPSAQKGSRTALKMLILLRCAARQPRGVAAGFLVLGVHM